MLEIRPTMLKILIISGYPIYRPIRQLGNMNEYYGASWQEININIYDIDSLLNGSYKRSVAIEYYYHNVKMFQIVIVLVILKRR